MHRVNDILWCNNLLKEKSMLSAFKDLGIAEHVLCALEAKGFETPSAVQIATIPLLLAGERDVVAQAQTGTGKTAAFGIPIIQILGGHSSRNIRALVLAPTRELSIQVAAEIDSLQGDADLQVVPVYGGQSIEIQLNRLRRGADVIVGTPGRIMDMMRRNALDFSQIDFAVLDEADEMLNMGFVEDIETILAATNPAKRMLMFSATMPDPILKIAAKFMREYEIVRCTPKTLATDLTTQMYFEVKRNDKLDALARIIDIEEDFFAMVFCRTRDDVDDVVEQLHGRGYDVEGLHGDIAQAQRTRVIDRFRQKRFNVLICTDVAARGIDVNNLTHVINYSIPQNAEIYIHRIGRTGRAGQQGTAITFVTPAEVYKLNQIKREAKCRIDKGSLPDAQVIVERKIAKLTADIEAVITGGKHEIHLPTVTPLLEQFGAENLAAALLSMSCGDELLASSYEEIGAKRRAEADRNRVRLYIGLGKMDGMGAKAILDYLFERTRIGCQKLGKVDCFDRFSFIDANIDDAETIVRAMRKETRNGRPIVEIAKERGERSDAPRENREFDRPAAAPAATAEDDSNIKFRERTFGRVERTFNNNSEGEQRRERRPERSFDRGERRPERSGERSFDRGERRPERSGERSFDRGERSFDRGERSFDRGERRPERSGERSFDRGERRPERSGERSFDRGERRFDRGERRPERSGERSFDRGYSAPRGKSFSRPADRSAAPARPAKPAAPVVMAPDGSRPLNRKERRALMFGDKQQ